MIYGPMHEKFLGNFQRVQRRTPKGIIPFSTLAHIARLHIIIYINKNTFCGTRYLSHCCAICYVQLTKDFS